MAMTKTPLPHKRESWIHALHSRLSLPVIPARAGMKSDEQFIYRVPACAGMT